jgi:hypothetical protein
MRLAWGQSLSCGRDCVFVVRLVTTVHLGRGDLGCVRLCHWQYVCHLYLVNLFFWWGTYRDDMFYGIIYSYCIKKRTLKAKRNLKVDSNWKWYLENPIDFNAPWFLRPILKFWVPTLFRMLMEFSTTLISTVSPYLASITLKFWSQEVTPFSSNQKFQPQMINFRDHNSWVASWIEAYG